MLRDSTVIVAVVRTRPRAVPLPMITMRKSIHGFLFPYMLMGLRLAALRAAGAPLLPIQLFPLSNQLTSVAVFCLAIAILKISYNNQCV